MIVTRLAHVALSVPDLEAGTDFYSGLLGLLPSGKSGQRRLLGSGRSTTFELSLREGPAGLDHCAFAVLDETALEAAAEALASAGVEVTEVDVASLPGLSGGLEFGLPSGHVLQLVLEEDPVGLVLPSAAAIGHHRGAGPLQIEHVTLMASKIKENAEFLVETLGLRISDSVQPAGNPWAGTWLRAGARHHDIAFLPCAEGEALVNHVAFAVPSVADLVRVCDGLAAQGLPLDSSIGRHVAGNNVFLYFKDPFGIRLEVNTDMATMNPAAPARILAEPLPFDAWRPGRPPALEGGVSCARKNSGAAVPAGAGG